MVPVARPPGPSRGRGWLSPLRQRPTPPSSASTLRGSSLLARDGVTTASGPATASTSVALALLLRRTRSDQRSYRPTRTMIDQPGHLPGLHKAGRFTGPATAKPAAYARPPGGSDESFYEVTGGRAACRGTSLCRLSRQPADLDYLSEIAAVTDSPDLLHSYQRRVVQRGLNDSGGFEPEVLSLATPRKLSPRLAYP
jgi:hypothetical protein